MHYPCNCFIIDCIQTTTWCHVMVNLTRPPEESDGDLVPTGRFTGTTPVPGNQGPQGWLQSDKQAHEAMWKLSRKSPTAITVLHFMISQLARGATGVIISAPAMARKLKISERSVKSAVKMLKDMKFVQILKSGNTNAYLINSRVAWQGKRGFRFTSFNAQIMVDEQEQSSPVDELIEEGNQLLEVPVMELLPSDIENQLDLDIDGPDLDEPD